MVNQPFHDINNISFQHLLQNNCQFPLNPYRFMGDWLIIPTWLLIYKEDRFYYTFFIN